MVLLFSMEIIHFDKVINVTSEVSGHEAGNLIRNRGKVNKGWLCQEGIGKGSVTFQMKKPVIVTSIKVENNNSSMVEILVGNSNVLENEFVGFVPVSVFMTPEESNIGKNQNIVKIFQVKDFKEEARTKLWDRLKVVCRQPYNKVVPFGLKSLEVQGRKQENMSGLANKGGDSEIMIGSFFKKALLKKKNSEASTPDVCEAETPSESQISEKEAEQKASQSHKKNKVENKGKTSSRGKVKVKDDSEKKTLGKSEEKFGKKKRKKPFKKLMEDVIFVISGFKNPLRGDIRNLGLEMGAKYLPDWNSHCTHLICAYENTPKFNEVKGKGKIVKKEWLERCHSDRKRYPWRKFALDKNDLKIPESEEEIEELIEKSDYSEEGSLDSDNLETTTLTSSSSFAKETLADDTATSRKSKKLKRENIVDPQSSQKQENMDVEEEYDAATDEDEPEIEREDTTDYPLPLLRDILTSKIICINPKLSIRPTIERYVVAFNGTVTDHIKKDVDYYITHARENISNAPSNLLCVKPSWILDMIKKEKFVDPAEHVV